jgi:hypothetical protein
VMYLSIAMCLVLPCPLRKESMTTPELGKRGLRTLHPGIMSPWITIS